MMQAIAALSVRATNPGYVSVIPDTGQRFLCFGDHVWINLWYHI